MFFRLKIACLVFLLAVSTVPAQKQEKTHPAKPRELRAAIDEADEIVVQDSSLEVYQSGGAEPLSRLYSSDRRKDMLELRDAITVEPPSSWFRCACIPPVEIILSRRGKELGVISIQEDLTISFSRWSGDARPVDEEKLLQWFDARGIKGPRRGVDRIRTQEQTDRANSERWLSAMPSSLQPLWPKIMTDRNWWFDPSSAPMIAADALKPELAKEFPDVPRRIRLLFGWFGSGAGPWSGFPGYEEVAARLLLEYQPDALISALQGKTLTDSEMEGAARFFAGYTYGALFRPEEDKTLINLMPAQLKRSLLDHVLKTDDRDNIERAQKAFDQN